MTRPATLLLIAGLVSANPAWPAACREVIVSNEGSGDIAIVDPAAGAVTARIPVGKRPRGMALSPDRQLLYVALSGSPAAPPGVDESTLPPADKRADGIGVVDLVARRLLRTFTGISDPERVAIGASGARLYVASEDQGTVVMFDSASGERLAQTPVGGEAEGVDLDPAGVQLYATSEAEGTVTVLDAKSLAAIATLPVGRRPRSTAFSPDGLRAYVANEASANISVIDTISLRSLPPLSLPVGNLPMRIAVPPAGSLLYASTGRGRDIVAIEPVSGRIVERAQSGDRPWDIAISPDGAELYAANGPSNDLSVFDLPELKLRARIHTGEKPWGVACRDNWWTREGIGGRPK